MADQPYSIMDAPFQSAGECCAGTLYLPAGIPKPPVIIMAHGFAAIRAFRLPAFADLFARAGMAVFFFDYRTFGDSEGEPRHWVSPGRHRADWRAALTHVAGMDSIDPARIILWGTSYSGGHVLALAAERPPIAAVIAQLPHVSGFATMFNLSVADMLRAVGAGLSDLAGMAIGRPHYSPVVGRTGTFAAMSSPGSWDGWFAMGTPDMASEKDHWENKVLSRAFLTLPWFSPTFSAHRISVPTLVIAGRNDTVTPPHAAERAAAKIPKGEFFWLPSNHFEPYVSPVFEENMRLQLDFLRRHGFMGR